MSTLTVLIADDHRLMADGIRRALAGADDIEVVGVARSGAEVLPLVGRTNPDAVLLDIRMPELDGLACLERLRSRHPDVKVIMLSVFNDPEHIEGALSRGASGYIVKSVDPADLAGAIRGLVAGTVDDVFGLPKSDDVDTPYGTPLTNRETSILEAVARGLSNQAISKQLWISEQTVKFHLTNIYRKLGVANRTEAARYAYQVGLADTLAEQG